MQVIVIYVGSRHRSPQPIEIPPSCQTLFDAHTYVQSHLSEKTIERRFPIYVHKGKIMDDSMPLQNLNSSIMVYLFNKGMKVNNTTASSLSPEYESFAQLSQQLFRSLFGMQQSHESADIPSDSTDESSEEESSIEEVHRDQNPLYQDQLETMIQMGFQNPHRIMLILQLCGGNIEAAIELYLQSEERGVFTN